MKHVSIRSILTESSLGSESLHKSMRKSNFGSVDGPIASCLEKGEVIGILRIKYNATECLLWYVRSSILAQTNKVGNNLDDIHDCSRLGCSARGARSRSLKRKGPLYHLYDLPNQTGERGVQCNCWQ